MRDVLSGKSKIEDGGYVDSRSSAAGAAMAPISPSHGARNTEEFWALKNISFEVKRGEVVGVVGRNGAGKSTLLKILSRITEPTKGRVEIDGRIASLLEVGTGFHPELTGRENVYLNGAILGMTRAEVRRKFDEIVAFAEVDRFIDTPVKRYSSGMYVRLAFAVAAHLEPEILIVDEVLAVGDLGFQKKCLGKMGEVASRQGRSILFVSHNMSAITKLCESGIYLESGAIVASGPIDSVVATYLRSEADGVKPGIPRTERQTLRKTKKLFFTGVKLLSAQKDECTELDVRFPFYFEIQFEVPETLSNIELSLRVLASDGRAVLTSLLSDMSPDALHESRSGTYTYRVEFPGMFLMPGEYTLNVAAHEPVGEIFDQHERVIAFTVRDTGTNFSRYGHYDTIGVVMRDLRWEPQPPPDSKPGLR
jgi:lipopolysaccharide transport system ATP-binding protein